MATALTLKQAIAAVWQKFMGVIGYADISGIGDGTIKGAIAGLNGNMEWSEPVSLGTCLGVIMTYRYNAKFVEIHYGGTLQGGIGFTLNSNGYEFPTAMPTELLPDSNIQEAIFCPGNNYKICVKMLPASTNKWTLASGANITTQSEYITGGFVYARK